MPAKTDIFVSSDVLSFSSLSIACAEYETLMQRLHGNQFSITNPDLLRVLTTETEVVVFVYEGTYMVATAQASLCQSPPIHHVLINNVVTRDGYDGRGFGRMAMESLERVAKKRWSNHAGLELLLTNSPRKANAGFYQSLGWKARSEENDNPTVVWVKHL